MDLKNRLLATAGVVHVDEVVRLLEEAAAAVHVAYRDGYAAGFDDAAQSSARVLRDRERRAYEVPRGLCHLHPIGSSERNTERALEQLGNSAALDLGIPLTRESSGWTELPAPPRIQRDDEYDRTGIAFYGK